MTTKRAFVYGVLVSITASFLFFNYQRSHAADRDKDKSTPRTPPQILLNTNALPKDSRGITSFAPVVKRVAPSVVTIYSTKTVRQNLGMSPFDDQMLRRFFGF